jgi:hypothetical protein
MTQKAARPGDDVPGRANSSSTDSNPPPTKSSGDFIADCWHDEAVTQAAAEGITDAPEWALESPTALRRWKRDRETASRPQRATGGQNAEAVAAHAQAALEDETRKLAETQRGGRNDQLNRAAFNLGQLIAAGSLDRATVERELEDACRANSYIQDDGLRDFNATLVSGLEDGMAQPRDLSGVGTGQSATYAGSLTIDGEVVEVADSPADADASPDRPVLEGEVIDRPMLADKLLTRADLRKLPKPKALIHNTLDQGTTALLYGMWDTCKTFLALDWALSVHTGRSWQGRTTERRRVLYVVGEGAYGFDQRVAAWEVGWSTPVPDAAALVLPIAVNLTRPVEVDNLRALIDWGGYSFIVLDTLARCMVGADENSAQDMGIVVESMTKLKDSTPRGLGTVLAVHHTGKDGKTSRGSVALEAGMDCVYFASRDGAVIDLERMKRKDGPCADHHAFALDPIPGTDSAVLSVHRGADKSTKADVLMSAFVHHFADTGASKAELRTVAEMPPATFHRSLSELVKRGELVNVGTDRQQFYRLAN